MYNYSVKAVKAQYWHLDIELSETEKIVTNSGYHMSHNNDEGADDPLPNTLWTTPYLALLRYTSIENFLSL